MFLCGLLYQYPLDLINMDLDDSGALLPPTTPPRRPPKRSDQLIGQHFESPKRRRPWRKDSKPVARLGLALEAKELMAEVAEIHKLHASSHQSPRDPTPPQDLNQASYDKTPSSFDDPPDILCDNANVEADASHISDSNKLRPRRLFPNESIDRLYSNWLVLIPTLVSNYLHYLKQTQGRLGRPLEVETKLCHRGICIPKESEIQCLHFDRACLPLRLSILVHGSYLLFADIFTVTFQACECATIPQILVYNGLFPTSPLQPRLAVSIDLLDFYSALFDRSADTVGALAGALKTMYSRRGFPIVNEKVSSNNNETLYTE